MIRTIAAVLILSVCASAWAQEILTPQGDWLPALPSRIATADAVICPVTLDAALAAGYRLPTDADYAAREAANAEAAAQAAQYADPQPAVFVPRVAGTITNIVGQSQVFVDGETGEVFALDETGSPEKTLAQTQAQNAARKVKVAAAKTAKAKGNGLNALAERVAALEALNGIE